MAQERDTTVRHETIRVLQDGPNAGKVVNDPAGMTIQRVVIPAGAENRVRDFILNRYRGLR